MPTTGSPDETADSLEPNIGTSIVGDVRLTFTVPDGWENNGWFVPRRTPTRSSARSSTVSATSSPIPASGWRLLHPSVPPSMTSSQRSPTCPPSTPPRRPTSPSTGTTESKSSSPSPTTPTTNASTEGSPCSKIQVCWAGPNYWAQGPHAHHRLWILDVDGTRLVIGGTYFPDTSQQDLDDLDTILNSIQIDPVEAEQSSDDDPVETSTASSTSSA